MYEIEEIEESIGRECAKEINAIFKYTSAKNNIGVEVIKINLIYFLQEIFTNIGEKYLDPSGENDDPKKSSENSDKSISPNKIGAKSFKINECKEESEKKKKNCACQNFNFISRKRLYFFKLN